MKNRKFNPFELLFLLFLIGGIFESKTPMKPKNRKWLGGFLLFLPIAILFCLTASVVGWLAAAGIWGLSLLLLGLVALGIYFFFEV